MLSLNGNDTAVIILIMVFISLFEFGPGPITWLYMAEILTDKAMSIGAVMNWMVNLVISAAIPGIITKIGQENIGWIFIIVGILSTGGFLFTVCFMKETRGKSAVEIEQMFAGEAAYEQRRLVGNKNNQTEDEDY